MKILKKVLLVIVIIIAVVLIVAAFTKSEYSVKRNVVINKPKAEVFDYIKYVKNQEQYSKWEKMDPAMKKTYTGTDGTVGFTSAWDSKVDSVGQGEQTIAKITEGEKLDLKIHFIKPFEGKADAYLATEIVTPTETKVTWGLKSKMPYPMNIFLLCMDMDKMIGDDLQTGLNNLKTVLETK
ncbi:SRPBCC family protein [Mucilaginibacter gynuensis]|uniref:SRPBCC family protein n=1 Tax=Mucilaginibacter gynuensis TaxID=1302236 RepID=A0ABP8GHG4_9SPHI